MRAAQNGGEVHVRPERVDPDPAPDAAPGLLAVRLDDIVALCERRDVEKQPQPIGRETFGAGLPGHAKGLDEELDAIRVETRRLFDDLDVAAGVG